MVVSCAVCEEGLEAGWLVISSLMSFRSELSLRSELLLSWLAVTSDVKYVVVVVFD